MIKKFLSTAIYTALLRFIPTRRGNIPDEEKSVAVIFLGALGDFLVFCGAAKSLTESGFTIDLVCRSGTGIDEFAGQTGLFRKVVLLDNRFLNRLSNIRKLKMICCRYAFAAPLSRYALNDIYTLAVSADAHILPEMVQECYSAALKSIADKKTDILVPVFSVWEWDRYTEFLNGCGLSVKKVTPYLTSRGNVKRKNIIAVFPGASVREKMWQTEHFAWVMNKLAMCGNYSFYIMGTSSDYQDCRDLAEMTVEAKPKVLCSNTVLSTIELLGECRLALTNDSGSAHMALYSKTPFVAVCGMWQDRRFFPNESLPQWCISVSCRSDSLSCKNCGKSIPDCTNHRCTAECVSLISPQTVFDAAIKLLDNT